MVVRVLPNINLLCNHQGLIFGELQGPMDHGLPNDWNNDSDYGLWAPETPRSHGTRSQTFSCDNQRP